MIGSNDVSIPSSVSDWLQSIKLSGYHNRFVVNGYDNMDRVRVIWELELVTVSVNNMVARQNDLGVIKCSDASVNALYMVDLF